MNWILAIIVGGIAGWIAEKIMKTDHSLLMNIILGIIGALIANFLFGLIGISAGGIIGYLIAGIVGACLLIWIGRLVRR